MRVLITGANGFVCSQIIRAAVDAGHTVRALVRSRERLERALAPLGAPPVEVALGEVLDAAAVKAALPGCDAVIHGAALYSFDPRRSDEMRRGNAEAARIVLGLAHEAGCDPIIHISSIAALWPMPRPMSADHDRDPPLGTSPYPYATSKRDSKLVARALQEKGAPVVTTYPSGVWGPHDPGAGEMVEQLRGILGNRVPFRVPGASFNTVDVRWLARAHAALLTRGNGPRRVTMLGHNLTVDECFAILRRLTGRRLPQLLYSPRALSMLTARFAGVLQRLVPTRVPVSLEATAVLWMHSPAHSAEATRLVGPMPPIEDTVRDSVAWMIAAGHIPPSWGGKLTAAPALPPAT